MANKVVKGIGGLVGVVVVVVSVIQGDRTSKKTDSRLSEAQGMLAQMEACKSLVCFVTADRDWDAMVDRVGTLEVDKSQSDALDAVNARHAKVMELATAPISGQFDKASAAVDAVTALEQVEGDGKQAKALRTEGEAAVKAACEALNTYAANEGYDHKDFVEGLTAFLENNDNGQESAEMKASVAAYRDVAQRCAS